MQTMTWSNGTNFAGALELLLDYAKNNAVPADQLPEYLFVLSDMQFDRAGGLDPHAAALIQRRFAEAGYPSAPHIVFWNLRACGRLVFQAECDAPGVSFMSGFAASALTDFFEGGVLPKSEPAVDPWDALQARLQRERLEPVRAVCRGSPPVTCAALLLN